MPIESVTVSRIVDAYLRHIRARAARGEYSRCALRHAERDLGRFVAIHGRKPVSKCRRFDLTEWLDLHPEWKSPWTRKRVIGSIVRPFLWAEENQLIACSPYKAPRMRNGRKRRPATNREYVTLMRGGTRPLRRALFFMRRTGCRTKEMRVLLWEQIDWQRSCIVYADHKSEHKHGRPRIIALDRPTLRFLANLYRKRPAWQLHVFVNCDGTPWDQHTFPRHVNRWGQRLGLEPTKNGLSPYCWRHSFGTRAIENGVGEKQLADLMGHADTRMVSYYAQTAGKVPYMRENLDKVNGKR